MRVRRWRVESCRLRTCRFFREECYEDTACRLFVKRIYICSVMFCKLQVFGELFLKYPRVFPFISCVDGVFS
jgi:hypothetical protein